MSTLIEVLKPICVTCANRLHKGKEDCPIQEHRPMEGKEVCKCVYHDAISMGMLADGNRIQLGSQKIK